MIFDSPEGWGETAGLTGNRGQRKSSLHYWKEGSRKCLCGKHSASGGRTAHEQVAREEEGGNFEGARICGNCWELRKKLG